MLALYRVPRPAGRHPRQAGHGGRGRRTHRSAAHQLWTTDAYRPGGGRDVMWRTRYEQRPVGPCRRAGHGLRQDRGRRTRRRLLAGRLARGGARLLRAQVPGHRGGDRPAGEAGAHHRPGRQGRPGRAGAPARAGHRGARGGRPGRTGQAPGHAHRRDRQPPRGAQGRPRQGPGRDPHRQGGAGRRGRAARRVDPVAGGR